jgi:hypothetical protein
MRARDRWSGSSRSRPPTKRCSRAGRRSHAPVLPAPNPPGRPDGARPSPGSGDPAPPRARHHRGRCATERDPGAGRATALPASAAGAGGIPARRRSAPPRTTGRGRRRSPPGTVRTGTARPPAPTGRSTRRSTRTRASTVPSTLPGRARRDPGARAAGHPSTRWPPRGRETVNRPHPRARRPILPPRQHRTARRAPRPHRTSRPPRRTTPRAAADEPVAAGPGPTFVSPAAAPRGRWRRRNAARAGQSARNPAARGRRDRVGRCGRVHAADGRRRRAAGTAMAPGATPGSRQAPSRAATLAGSAVSGGATMKR